MPTTISIQGTFSYGILPLIILFLIIISPLLIKRAEKKKAKKQAVNENVSVNLKPVPLSVKERYASRLANIRDEFDDGKRDSRDSYQLLSFLIREFVYEYTGIDVTNKTLAEIRGLKIKKLEKLIEEYYACEFAPDEEGDIHAAIRKTIKVIEEWN